MSNEVPGILAKALGQPCAAAPQWRSTWLLAVPRQTAPPTGQNQSRSRLRTPPKPIRTTQKYRPNSNYNIT
eukprot:357777-Amphidinium_carterae.1